MTGIPERMKMAMTSFAAAQDDRCTSRQEQFSQCKVLRLANLLFVCAPDQLNVMPEVFMH